MKPYPGLIGRETPPSDSEVRRVTQTMGPISLFGFSYRELRVAVGTIQREQLRRDSRRYRKHCGTTTAKFPHII